MGIKPQASRQKMYSTYGRNMESAEHSPDVHGLLCLAVGLTTRKTQHCVKISRVSQPPLILQLNRPVGFIEEGFPG